MYQQPWKLYWSGSNGFISLRRERRHLSTLERQTKKFNLLGRETQGAAQTSNMAAGNKKITQTKKKKFQLKTTQTQTTGTKIDHHLRIKEGGMDRKWVHNLSKTPLTEDQEKVLARGPNFSIVTKPPVGKYISQIERVCQQLNQGKAEELRGETKAILKNIRPPRPNISKGEEKAIQKIEKRPRKDNTDC